MADVLAVRDEYRAQTWAMLIQECNNSGLTKREFCSSVGSLRKASTTGSGSSAVRWQKLPDLSWYSWNLLLFRMTCCRSNTGEQN